MSRSSSPFHKFDRWVKESSDFQTEQRKRADVAWNFIDGKQWTEAELTELAASNQAPTVVNLLFPMLNAISSVELNRRTDYSVVAREASDETLSNVITHIVHQIFAENSFKFTLGRGFRNGMITGCSWFEVFPEKDLDTNQDFIRILLRPFEEFFYDPHASEYDLSDARYISREVWMDFDQVQDIWGEDKANQIRAFFDQHALEDFRGRESKAQATTGRHVYTDKARGRVAVHEMYYKNGEGRIRHVIFSGDVFLEGTEEGDEENKSPYDFNFYPYVPYIAMWDKTGAPLGPVEIGRPIQEIINKSQSKVQYYIACNGLIYEEGAFTDEDQALAEWNKPNRKIPLTDGGLAKIKDDNHIAESQNIMGWIQLMVQTLQRVMGVNDSVIGAGGVNARSAIQEQTRVAQGEGMQAAFIEPLYFTKLAILKVVLKMVGQFYTNERVVRLTQPNGQSEFTRINSTEVDEEGVEKPFNQINDILRFDVDVKEELPFTNTKELTARTLSEVLKVVPVTTPALIPPLLDNLSGINNKAQVVQQVEGLFQQQPTNGQVQ